MHTSLTIENHVERLIQTPRRNLSIKIETSWMNRREGWRVSTAGYLCSRLVILLLVFHGTHIVLIEEVKILAPIASCLLKPQILPSPKQSRMLFKKKICELLAVIHTYNNIPKAEAGGLRVQKRSWPMYWDPEKGRQTDRQSDWFSYTFLLRVGKKLLFMHIVWISLLKTFW